MGLEYTLVSEVGSFRGTRTGETQIGDKINGCGAIKPDGRIATPLTEEQNTCLLKEVKDRLPVSHRGAWIGIRRMKHGSRVLKPFKYVGMPPNADNLQFFNFSVLPKRLAFKDRCVYIGKNAGGWSAGDCSQNLSAICQRKASEWRATMCWHTGLIIDNFFVLFFLWFCRTWTKRYLITSQGEGASSAILFWGWSSGVSG